MKTLFRLLTFVIVFIAILVFAAGLFITGLGVYDFTHAFAVFDNYAEKGSIQLSAIALLRAVDLFLMAIVLFVFSIGLMVLFNNRSEQALPTNFPSWLKVKNFIELKITLWEAILTTILVGYLGYLVELRLERKPIVIQDVALPVAIFLIATSLFFMKKGGH